MPDEIPAQAETPEALFEAGKKFYFSGRSSANDPLMALAYFERAAKMGYAPAQRLLGVCLLDGQIAKKDPEVARQWLELAAKQDDPQANFELAKIYAQGISAPKDWGRAYAILCLPFVAALPEARALAIRLKEELWGLYPNLLEAVKREDQAHRGELGQRNHRFVQSFLTPGRATLDREEFEIILTLNLGKTTPENALAALKQCLTQYYEKAIAELPA
ncbi:MAG: sel1 repeat family protein [Deltaproteobacteria bacterium]|jgi:hypothetical protein|nr:sel1 repeat family protein [Deltaproteobacteria bacterium]